MAVSLGFGVLFATMISLVLVPCTYLIVDDLGNLLFGRELAGTPIEAEPPPRRPLLSTGRSPSQRDRRAVG
jgi:hypothetical protein